MDGTSMIPGGWKVVDAQEFDAWLGSKDSPDWFNDAWCGVIFYCVRHNKKKFAAVLSDGKGTVKIDPQYLKS